MGTGKSAVGRKLATRLRWRFFDTDILIEQEAKTPIVNIFAQKGEAHFRVLESEVIDRICREKKVVIATGGGAIVSAKNATRLRESGVVICLTATPETIFARVRGNTDRPLLQDPNPLAKIRSLLALRAEAYAKADMTIDTTTLNVERIVETILSRVAGTT